MAKKVTWQFTSMTAIVAWFTIYSKCTSIPEIAARVTWREGLQGIRGGDETGMIRADHRCEKPTVVHSTATLE